MLNSKILALVMDDVLSINPKKDSSFAMMLAAQKRGYQLVCFDTHQMSFNKAGVFAQALIIEVTDNNDNFVKITQSLNFDLLTADLIFMRKDPPFDMNYIYTTYLLEQVQKQGVRVINKPQSLRDFNEKVAIMQFPDCITDTLISANTTQILQFLTQHKTIVIKPLDGMGGVDIFKLQHTQIEEARLRISQLTKGEKIPLMAQFFLSDIKNGDKRILIINGKPIPFALNRIPPKNNWKGNLAQGATGIAQPLNNRDYWLCEQIAPTLKQKGLVFVGLDVIGDYITEINVTSPTGIRELNTQCDLDIATVLFQALESDISA